MNAAMNSAPDGRSYAAPRASSDSHRQRTAYADLQGQQRLFADPPADRSNAQRPRDLAFSPGNPGLNAAGQPPDPAGARNGKRMDVPADTLDRDKHLASGASSSKSGKPRGSCQSCKLPLTGQFVRALESTYHLECFKCQDCGEVVASKFFPVDNEDGTGLYPLCETDYFRRLDLLCSNCGGALRGSYVTALDRKYHIDHFTCSVCPTAFGAKDSYYEHDGKVYCHFHYSTRFAQRCNGCSTAILKQFVEIFRNGQNQHWHPECYMIHKFWNVRLASSLANPDENRLSSEDNADEEQRGRVKQQEEYMEEKTYRIWSVLSSFEETSAACISDMLLHVSNGAYMEGVLVAKRFIQHVEVLFSALDSLDHVVISHGIGGLSYGREAKLLCKRIVSFFSLLTKTQDTGVKRLGVTQELLSLVTGLAHYLKLLIRISLQGALKLEKDRQTIQGLEAFLEELSRLEGYKDQVAALDETSSISELAEEQSDLCISCASPIDDECLKAGAERSHLKHLQCSNCNRSIGDELGLNHAVWLSTRKQAFCPNCSTRYEMEQDAVPVEHITRLQQYVYLLRVALARLLSVLRFGGTLPHTSDDPNLTTYDSQEGHRIGPSDTSAPLLSADMRSKSFGGTTANESNQSSYQETVGEMKRLRSTRMDKHLSSTMKQARRSRVIPEMSGPGQTNFHIEDDQEQNGHQQQSDIGIRQDALTLDDLPRILTAQQVKEQRPNAYRHAQNKLMPSQRQPRFMTGHQRGVGDDEENGFGSGYPAERTKKFFSELTALEYFIVRHVAVLQMQPLLEGHFNLEDLLSLIETRKQTFWNKFFNKNAEKPKGNKKKGVFGVNLEILVDRDGVESEHGVGPGALRVPSLLDDSVTAMRQMDMSVEGVFRKNGNIRGLRDLSEKIDAKEVEIDLSKENPVQVAALLKKFLREMPDPLLTHKLYDLYMTSQKIADEAKRKRVLHLTCCLLPKVHRDCLEILFSFLNWTASFSQVDEDTGSKMDTHNLATVIAPNILLRDSKAIGAEDSYLAVEAVYMLLEYNDEMCEVPEDIQSVLSDTEIFNNMPEYTTKEILKRYGDVVRQPDRHFGSVKPEAADMPPLRSETNNSTGSRPTAPVLTRVDTDPHQANAWQKESSVRHVQQNGMPGYPPPASQNTPPQFQHDFTNRNSPYHQHGASNGSIDHMAAPARGLSPQPRPPYTAYAYPSPSGQGPGGFAPS